MTQLSQSAASLFVLAISLCSVTYASESPQKPQNIIIRASLKSPKSAPGPQFEKTYDQTTLFKDGNLMTDTFEVKDGNPATRGKYAIEIFVQKMTTEEVYKVALTTKKMIRNKPENISSILVFTYNPRFAGVSKYYVPKTDVVMETAIYSEETKKDL